MTKEAQRIAIAEACGYQLYPSNNPSQLTWQMCGVTVESLPDYLNDLNAMHEAEKTLHVGLWNHYTQQLEVICDRDAVEHEGGNPWGVFATAAQRCEAFLRTANLWTE